MRDSITDGTKKANNTSVNPIVPPA